LFFGDLQVLDLALALWSWFTHTCYCIYRSLQMERELTVCEKPVTLYPSVCKAWINSVLLISDTKLVVFTSTELLFKLLGDSRLHILQVLGEWQISRPLQLWRLKHLLKTIFLGS